MSTQYTVHQGPATTASFRLMNADSGRLGQLKDAEMSDEDRRGPVQAKRRGKSKIIAHQSSKYAALLEPLLKATSRIAAPHAADTGEPSR